MGMGLTASSLARGIRTPGTGCGDTTVVMIEWVEVEHTLTCLITTPEGNYGILGEEGKERLGEREGEGVGETHCSVGFVHDLHTVSDPITRDERVPHSTRTLWREPARGQRSQPASKES